MPIPLRLLLVEDSEADAALLLRQLTADSYEVISARVASAPEMAAALDQHDWDLVIADNSLPTFSAPDALALARRRDLPVIIVSGNLDHEAVAACMRQGAVDYLLKDRLGRLGAAVRRALDEHRLQAEQRRAAQQIRLQARLLDTLEQAVIATDPQGAITYWNHFAERLYGWAAPEVLGRNILEITPSTVSRAHVAEMLRQARAGGRGGGEFSARRRDGSTFPAWGTNAPLHDEAGALIGIVGVSEDHTERLRALQEAEALATVSVALASSLDPATLYRVILEQATSVLPCDYASVLLYEDGWVTVAAAWGTPERPAGTRLFPLAGPGRLWLPTTPGIPTIVSDSDLEPAWSDIAPLVGERRMRSAMGMPITIDGNQVGAFTLNSSQPHFYTEQHARLIALFAERFSLALRNARRFADEQKRAHAAEALAQLRADFVAAVSHELRTPLTAIVGFGELLDAHWEHMIDATRRERVGRIVQAANRLHRLVEDLLLISRIETERLVPASMPLDLAPLLAQAVAEVQAHYRGPPILLHGDTGVQVRADPTRAIQVLVNLLDNAAKYSPEGSPIAVSWQRAGEMIVVRVADRGTGVPEEGRDQLFTRFGRIPGSRIRAGRVGTGLGLYLSRRLAEAMGGDLDLEATGPDGSTFRLRLPIVS